MTDTILLAGATGMFGSRIAHHLLARPDARVRRLMRNITGNRDKIER